MVPLPSAAANSGLPFRGIVPTTVPSAALMAVAFLPRPLKGKTGLVTGSERMGSGLASVFTLAMDFNVLRSKIGASFRRPLLVETRPRAGATAVARQAWVL